ncbi:hypothetical protein LWI29_012597 [Acer saccharum]|uniref:Uncharacterized protein n=1 Tax=Acer saccharum TaxID=4024 RepID=A0AA39SL45_ACESA|nr:hypothetical protein LWI29_012597 [Acer saccharum]
MLDKLVVMLDSRAYNSFADSLANKGLVCKGSCFNRGRCECYVFSCRCLPGCLCLWFAIQKSLPGSKQRRGEHVFLDCSTPRLISNHIVSSGTKKSYIVRAMLPSILPPSYKGTTIRYLYYIRSTLSAKWLILDNGHTHWKSIKDPTEVVCH